MNSISLSSIVDFCNTFAISTICFFGIVTNTINIIVFLSKELKHVVFKYYLVMALSNFIYLSISFFFFSAKCGIYCDLTSTYATQLYLYIFYRYIKGIFAILSICIEITVALYRLFIVTNRDVSRFVHYKSLIAILFIFSAIFYSPNIFTQQLLITQTNVTTNVTIGANNSLSTHLVYKYSATSNDFGKSELGKWIVIVTVTILRGFVALIAISIIDILTLIKFRTHLRLTTQMKESITRKETIAEETKVATATQSLPDESKTKPSIRTRKSKNQNQETNLTKEETINRNLTLMVISVGLLFSVGNIPNSIVYIYQQYYDVNGVFFRAISVVGNMILFFTVGADIFVYLTFNKLYKKNFKRLFRCS